LKSDEGISLAKNMQSRSCYLSNQEGELGLLWEMQDVEDFNQTNEGNNEEGRKETSTCRHTTFEQNSALGSFGKGLKNDLPLVIHASKLTK
jgi:hypothetical protein